MSHPPASLPTQSKRPRRPWVRLSGKPEVRSIQVGVVVTILFHALLFWIAPKFNLGPLDNAQVAVDPSADPARNFEIEIPQDMFQMPEKPKPPANFVETNPDAPDNEPDQTNNFSSQNQQVAQEKPTPDGKSEAPAMDGDKEKKSNSIVTGQLSPPTPPSQPESEPLTTAEQQAIAQEAARRAQTPLSGFEKVAGENTAGIGSNIAKVAPHPTEVKETVEGAPDATTDQGVVAGSRIKIDPKRPAARPILTANVKRARPAPLMDNPFGTDNIGITGYNAKWSNYGVYLQRLIEAIQVQWENDMHASSVKPPNGSHVEVVFRINSQGVVYEFTKVTGTGGSQYSSTCVTAIKLRSPYGPWTDDMIALLGESQDLTFTFYYN